MANIIVGSILILLAIGCGAISVLQFLEKGFLFNNAYIWATKEEREKLDKKPHYRQSGIVFALCAVLLLIVGTATALANAALMLLGIPVAIVILFYAVASSFKGEQKSGQ